MQLWTLPAHLPHWKRTVRGTHPRSALWEEELGAGQREAACLHAVSKLQSQPLLPCGHDRFTFTTIRHNAAVSRDLWSYNSLFESTVWILFLGAALVPLPDYSGKEAQNGGQCRALEGREWKPFYNTARPGQKNNSRCTGQWRFKGRIFSETDGFERLFLGKKHCFIHAILASSASSICLLLKHFLELLFPFFSSFQKFKASYLLMSRYGALCSLASTQPVTI